MSPADDPGQETPVKVPPSDGRRVPRWAAVGALVVLVVAVVVAGVAVQSLRSDLSAAQDRTNRADAKAEKVQAELAALQKTADELRATRTKEAKRLESDGWSADAEPGIYIKAPGGRTSPLCPEGGCTVYRVRTDSVRSCPDELVVDAYVYDGDAIIDDVQQTVKKVKAGSTHDVVFSSKQLGAGDSTLISNIECT
jgi:hypothetical protein